MWAINSDRVAKLVNARLQPAVASLVWPPANGAARCRRHSFICLFHQIRPWVLLRSPAFARPSASRRRVTAADCFAGGLSGLRSSDWLTGAGTDSSGESTPSGARAASSPRNALCCRARLLPPPPSQALSCCLPPNSCKRASCLISESTPAAGLSDTLELVRPRPPPSPPLLSSAAALGRRADLLASAGWPAS